MATWENLLTADAGNGEMWTDWGGGIFSPWTRGSTYARTGIYAWQFGQLTSAAINVIQRNTYYTRWPIYLPVGGGQAGLSHGLVYDPYQSGTGFTAYISESTPADSYVECAIDTIKIHHHVPMHAGHWYVIESKLYLDPTNGQVAIKVDGVDEGSWTGDTSSWSGYATAGYLFWRWSGVGGGWIDDIAIRADNWCGLGGLYVRTPNNEGTHTDWTANAGGKVACVDEIPGDLTDYIYKAAASAGSKQSFVGSDAGHLRSINTAALASYAKTSSGTGNLIHLLRSAGVESNSAEIAQTTTAKYAQKFWETDPATGLPWNYMGLNNCELGVKVGATGGAGDLRVGGLQMVIDAAVAAGARVQGPAGQFTG